MKRGLSVEAQMFTWRSPARVAPFACLVHRRAFMLVFRSWRLAQRIGVYEMLCATVMRAGPLVRCRRVWGWAPSARHDGQSVWEDLSGPSAIGPHDRRCRWRSRAL